ncbi:HET-domain-containing protein, partial [Melanomma pulvis-pyrius CBS 109.77]
IKKMNSPRNAFSYQPLSKSSRGGFETRLIYLHPGGFNDCIYCTIYHANILEKQPQTEYTALSYVWGDATQTQSIQLGYHQLPTITTNLERALRHLRDRTSERILWVDAICINQSDWEERLSQVEQMSSVYEKAVEVRIWLG